MDHHIRFTLNGVEKQNVIPSERLLIDLLRDDCGLTGTKEGCSVGVCGACSVMVDGELVSACLMPAIFVDGSRVTTVEGLAAADGTLSRVQEAFIEYGGFQSGICTPGQVVAPSALLDTDPAPSIARIPDWMTRNRRRCTGYEGVVGSTR